MRQSVACRLSNRTKFERENNLTPQSFWVILNTRHTMTSRSENTLDIRSWTEKDAQMISEGAKNTEILCHARGE